jgi:hypothetical protein
MSWALKPISRDAVEAALEKARVYRLLNEPSQAESICLDVLGVDEHNQQALITLILAMTDQFGRGPQPWEAKEFARQLPGEYEREYYLGIIEERTAWSHLRLDAPGARFDAYELLREAMTHYERAESLRPAGNDDALLRWNTCARFLERHPEVGPRPADSFEPILSE